MIEVTYTDGSKEDFVDANVWLEDSDAEKITLYKRTYDEDKGYDEDEDEAIALINLAQVKCIKKR